MSIYINGLNSSNNIGNGIYVYGIGLSGTTLNVRSLTANSNVGNGFLLSDSTLKLTAPLLLNINNLIASNNGGPGLEAYCITGNLSSIILNNNISYGIKTSIGNGVTVFDGISSEGTLYAFGVLSALNYFPTIIKNSNLKSPRTSILLDSSKFSEFFVNTSTLSGGLGDLQLMTTRNVLEGSYMFTNTNVSPIPFNPAITDAVYQKDVYRTAGFVFTNTNNATGYDVTYLAAGTRIKDFAEDTNMTDKAPSERLVPQSLTTKLRSGSKFVAMNAGDYATISMRVKISPDYNGSNPRLILRHNGALGINKNFIIKEISSRSNTFELISGRTPTVNSRGVLEFYIDCDGTQGWINIDEWTVR
jgi:hypothetical protein